MKSLTVVLKSTLQWTGVVVCAIVVFHALAVAQPRPWSGWDWLSHVSDRAGLIIPFAAFASGIVLLRKWRLRIRLAWMAGLIAAVTAYALSEFVSPLADYAEYASAEEAFETRPLGPRTPFGKLRQLRFVEANPPVGGSPLSSDASTPPNRVRLLLHLPLAMGVFTLLNMLLGLLSAELTRALRPPSRRNARFAIGLAGGLAYFAAVYFASHPERDWFNVSGILGAWLPLAVPLIQAAALAGWILIRYREGFLGDPALSGTRPSPAHEGI